MTDKAGTEEFRSAFLGQTAESSHADLDGPLVRRRGEVFERLVHDFPLLVGKTASKREREEDVLVSTNLVYGEIEFEPYAFTIEKIKKRYQGLSSPLSSFYDLGSGTGKPVGLPWLPSQTFAAALMHPFAKCVGIEYLKGLHGISLDLLKFWEENVFPTLDFRACNRIAFNQGDFLDFDWSDGDLVFANSTCFGPALMESMATKAEEMKPGSFFITFTKKLPTSAFTVLEHERYQMSWGDATVYIQRRN